MNILRVGINDVLIWTAVVLAADIAARVMNIAHPEGGTEDDH